MDSTGGSCLCLMIDTPFVPMKISSQVGLDNVRSAEGWEAIAVVSTEMCRIAAAKLVCVVLPHTHLDLLVPSLFMMIINSMALTHKTEMREKGATAAVKGGMPCRTATVMSHLQLWRCMSSTTGVVTHLLPAVLIRLWLAK